MAGEWLTATANTNMFTYEIAPVFILMEHVVLQKMRELIGWSGGDSILAPGGSISNLYAFLAARHKMFPAYKERGLAAIGGQLVMFTSDQVHFPLLTMISVYFFIPPTGMTYRFIFCFLIYLLISWDTSRFIFSLLSESSHLQFTIASWSLRKKKSLRKEFPHISSSEINLSRQTFFLKNSLVYNPILVDSFLKRCFIF